MSCKLPFLRKSLLSLLVIAGLSALWITGFGFAVAPAFGQSAQVPRYQFGSIPPELQPVIPPNDDIIVYIHGGPGSRLEEASDLVKPLLDAGLAKGKRYTIISFDQPSQGYSSMRDPGDIVPDHEKTGTYYPMVVASEEFIVGLINELDKVAHIKNSNRNIYFIGGSTGGMQALRMGHRSEPWIKKIVAWNPASVWRTYARADVIDLDGWAKGFVLDQGFRRVSGTYAPNFDAAAARSGYFTGVFGPVLHDLGQLGQYVGDIQPNPEEWYRGNRDSYPGNADTNTPVHRDEWACKWDYIGGARLEQQEVYNRENVRWHYRLGTEELLFSFFNDNDKWDGPAKTASNKMTAGYQHVDKPTLLVASDDDDWNEGYVPKSAIAGVTALAGSYLAPGGGTLIGGLVGGATGAVAGPIYFHWEDRWSRTREMASSRVNLPLFSTLYLPNTGHSIHNERPQLFATQIVQFLTGGPLTTTYDPNLADEPCQTQLPKPSQPSQSSQFAFPLPAQLLENPGLVMEPARLGGKFSDASEAGTYGLQLKTDLLKDLSSCRTTSEFGFDPLCTLAKAAAKYYNNDTLRGNAFADLAVTGRNSYSSFASHAPTESEIQKLLIGIPDGPKLRTAIHAAQDRAYQVAWALRNPNPDAAYRFRRTLGWIAVSGVDDPAARPVNVPSGIPVFGPNGRTQVSAYPQYEATVRMCPNFNSAPYAPRACDSSTPGSVPFQIRYTVAGLPDISDVNPKSVSSGSAVPITIRGGNLVDIKFVSPVAVFPFTVNSPTQITANIPSTLRPGVYPIQVSTGAGYSSGTINITVFPVITKVFRPSGPITGGTPVQLSVAGASPGMTVSFDGKIPPLARCLQDQCWFTTPPSARPGPVNVVVSVPGLSPLVPPVPSAPFQFNYTASPVIAGLGPMPATSQNYYVSLDGNAPRGGAVITIQSKSPQLVTLAPEFQSIHIPEGFTSAPVPLKFVPTCSGGTAHLNVMHQGVSTDIPVAAPPWPPISMGVIALNGQQARPAVEAANLTVTLCAVAPQRTLVTLKSNDAAVDLQGHELITIPPNGYTATVGILGKPRILNNRLAPRLVTITATYSGGSIDFQTWVPFGYTLPPCKSDPSSCQGGVNQKQ